MAEATSFDMWMTQGDIEFWSKAQSVIFFTRGYSRQSTHVHEQGDIRCAGNRKWVDASKPTSRGIIWGCPTAIIPKGSPGHYTWETSTFGRYATKTIQTLKPGFDA